MGKGKKKGQKKEEPESSSSSLQQGVEQTDQALSTGQVQPPAQEQDKEKMLPAAQPKPEASVSDKSKESEANVEEMDGLGLDTGTKKRRPRKKKGQTSQVVPEPGMSTIRESSITEHTKSPPESVLISPGAEGMKEIIPPPGFGKGQEPTTHHADSAEGIQQSVPGLGRGVAGYGRGQQAQGFAQEIQQSVPGRGRGVAGYGRGQQAQGFAQEIQQSVPGRGRGVAGYERGQQAQGFAQEIQQSVPGRGRGVAGYGRGQQAVCYTQEIQQSVPGRGRGVTGYGRGQQVQSGPSQTSDWSKPSTSTVQTTEAQTLPPISDQRKEQRTAQPVYIPVSTVSQSSFGKKDVPERKSAEKSLSIIKIPDAIRRNTVPARKIVVLANYLPMTIKFIKIHRYDVAFNPEKPKKMLSMAFLKAKAAKFNRNIIAFDQMKNCYTIQPLEGVTGTQRYCIDVELKDSNNKVLKFEVSFKYTGVVDLNRIGQHMANCGSSLNSPTEAIQCIDVILRHGTLESYVKAGKQFFKRPDRPIDLGYGLEMWTGLFQSAIFTNRPYINIDVAHKGFPRKQSMIDALSKDFRLDPRFSLEKQRNIRSVELFHEFLKGLKVTALLGGDTSTGSMRREFICNRVVEPPNSLQFTMTLPNGRQQKLTVAEYFKTHKNYRLKYPDLNCIWVGPMNKNIYFPMELLEVTGGQPLKKQLNEMQLSRMVTEAATAPNIRKSKIEEVIRDMKYSNNEFFKHFGLQISDQFIEVEAKLLQPPRLMVGGGRTVDPRRGAWMSNTVLQPGALRSWGFIAIETDPNQCNYERIIETVMRVGTQMGMQVAKPMCSYFNIRITELMNVLFTALERDINFLFVIVSKNGRDYYHKVKRIAELEVGILTQCIKEETAARRINDQTVKNILLKVNSKLMGINQALDGRSMPSCLKGPVMIVGADVTHPSPEQTNIPSIAAVTASIDQKCFLYNIELSVQTPKKEIIVEFEDMMVEHMQVFRKHQNTLPKKIYVFRDGVSEGQFEEVMNSELASVYRAYQRLTGNKERPEVLFLLVQKRHHTRFFSGAQNPQNVEPGTVVDKQIVHAKELDFYLVSHQAIKGTARPTRYHAVANDGGIPMDEVEQLTYYLCHMYARCMRAVSYPTPTYYAHLACLRAKSLTHGDKFNNEELERKPKRLHVLKKMLDFSRMFFV